MSVLVILCTLASHAARSIEVRKKMGQTDGRQTITLRLPLDAATASVITRCHSVHCILRHATFKSAQCRYRRV